MKTTTIGIPVTVGVIRDNGSPEKFYAMQGELPGGLCESSYKSEGKAREALRGRMVKALDFASLMEQRGIFFGAAESDGARYGEAGKRIYFVVLGNGEYWHSVEGSAGCTMGRFEASEAEYGRFDAALSRKMAEYGRVVHAPSFIPAQF